MPRIKCCQCLRPAGYCYCDQLQMSNNQWPVWILQHPKEVSHVLGTARMAHLGLSHSKLMTGSKVSDCDELVSLIDTHKPLLVFPSKDSIELSAELMTPRPLLFLDATWRKAKRMVYESPELSDLTHVHLVNTEKPRYKIRKAPNLPKVLADEGDLHAEPLSTLEAIVLSLRSLEGDAHKYQSMLDTMEWVVQRQIDTMGVDVYSKNYS